MDTTDPFVYFNSFDIDLVPQSTSVDGSGERISQLRRRLMQFGKAMSELEHLEQEMQHQQKLRAQQALSDQIRILNASIQGEKRKMQQLRRRAEYFLETQCRGEFIPQTADLHRILSEQYAESQHQVIERYKTEIAEIRNNIKSEPSQMIRLFYILFSIRDILSNMRSDDHHSRDQQPPDLMMEMEENRVDPDEMKQEEEPTNYRDLQSTQQSLIEYLSDTLPLIVSRYQNAIERTLRDVSWPKLGDHKVMDMSSPLKWADVEQLCSELFEIEYFVHFMIENDIFPEITSSSNPSQISWVIESFLDPIRKRFTFNFGGNRKTNNLSKPEWFLHFIIECIEDNLSVLTQILHPLVQEQGVEIDIEREFIIGLMDLVKIKCKENIDILMKLHSDSVHRSRSFSRRKELYQTSADVTRNAIKGMKVMTEMSTQGLQSLYSSSLSTLLPLRRSQSTKNTQNENDNEEEIGNKRKSTKSDDDEETEFEQKQMESMERSKSADSGNTASTVRMNEDRNDRERRKKNDHRLKMVMLLIRHTIREMVAFQSQMNGSYHWIRTESQFEIEFGSESESVPPSECRVNVMSVILKNELCAAEWLSMEKERMNEESVLINAQYEMRWIFDLVHRDIVSHDDYECDHYLTNAVQDTLQLLEGIGSRIATITDPQWQNRFVKELMIQVLRLCADYLESEFPNYCHHRKVMKDEDIMICCGIINSSDYLCVVLEQWNAKDLYRALFYYREWTLGEAVNDTHDAKDGHRGIFGDLIRQNQSLKVQHLTILGDVLCREFVTECGQYLGETFGFIQYVQHQQREREEEDDNGDVDGNDNGNNWNGSGRESASKNVQNLSIQEEFEFAYYHLAESLYSCSQSLPRRIFDNLRREIGRNIDKQLFDAVLNMKYTFFLGASRQLRCDLEYMFSLFYAETMEVIPNYQRIDSRSLGDDNRFPLLVALLDIVCLNEEELDAFSASLGVGRDVVVESQEIDEETLAVMKKKYGVERLRIKQIEQIVNKIAVRKKSKTAGNPTDDTTDEDSIDLSDDLGTTRF